MKFFNQKNKIYDLITNNKNKLFMALTVDFFIFIIKKGIKWKIRKSSMFEFEIFKQDSLNFEYKKFNKIQFFSFPFLSKKLHGFFSFDHGIKFLTFVKKKKKIPKS